MRGYLFAVVVFSTLIILGVAVIPIVWPYLYMVFFVITGIIHFSKRKKRSGLISEFWLNNDQKQLFIKSLTAFEKWEDEYNRLKDIVKSEGLKKKENGELDRRSKRGKELDDKISRLTQPFLEQELYKELRMKPRIDRENYISSLVKFYVLASAGVSWVVLASIIYFIKYFDLVDSFFEVLIVPFHLLGIIDYSNEYIGFKQIEIDGKWVLFLVADILSLIFALVFGFIVGEKLSTIFPKPPLVNKDTYLEY